MCVAERRKILGTIDLPIAGLISELPCTELVKEIENFEETVALVCESSAMMVRITIISLTASASLRVTDLGIVDGKIQEFVPLFKE